MRTGDTVGNPRACARGDGCASIAAALAAQNHSRRWLRLLHVVVRRRLCIMDSSLTHPNRRWRRLRTASGDFDSAALAAFPAASAAMGDTPQRIREPPAVHPRRQLRGDIAAALAAPNYSRRWLRL